jgi:hypothetical protein
LIVPCAPQICARAVFIGSHPANGTGPSTTRLLLRHSSGQPFRFSFVRTIVFIVSHHTA